VSAVGLPIAAGSGRLSAAVRRFLEEECFVVLVFAASVALVACVLPTLVTQDTWVALVDGRYIAQHGLPRVDEMAVMTHGARWTDQQWLAHLTLYEVAREGGLRLALGLGLALLFLALGLAAFFARRAGGSARSVALVTLVPLCIAPWLLQLRTQTLVLPVFVTVYGLLAADSRRPSTRVWLVLPLLVLWANLHGSVVLGAVLVACHGLVLSPRHRLPGLVLACAAPATLVVTPYGLQSVAYYRWTLVGSPLRKYVTEWRPASLGAGTALFFLAALAIVFALGRHGKALSVFERIALPLLLVATFAAMRNGTWFALAVGVSVPLLVDAAWGSARALPDGARHINRRLAACVAAVAAVVVAGSLARPATSFEAGWPEAGARAVAAAAGTHGLVLADDVHNDWLLWKEPQLEGRLAYDVRFELLRPTQLAKLSGFWHERRYRSLAAPYRVFAVGRSRGTAPWSGKARTAFAGTGFVVLIRP
jgi:hypothetical protein